MDKSFRAARGPPFGKVRASISLLAQRKQPKKGLHFAAFMAGWDDKRQSHWIPAFAGMTALRQGKIKMGPSLRWDDTVVGSAEMTA